MKFISQMIMNIFFSCKWYQNYYPNDFFVQVNGNWRKLSNEEWISRSFKRGEKIQTAYTKYLKGLGSAVCQNDSCKSLVSVGSIGIKFTVKHREGYVYCFECSCCGQTQYFLPEYLPKEQIQKMIPCNHQGYIINGV